MNIGDYVRVKIGAKCYGGKLSGLCGTIQEMPPSLLCEDMRSNYVDKLAVALDTMYNPCSKYHYFYIPKTDLVLISSAIGHYIQDKLTAGIVKVIFNDQATIVLWSDGTKTVVKCGENDFYDPEKGLALAISKKYLGNKGNYYNTFKKWLPKEDELDHVDNDFLSPIKQKLKTLVNRI